MRREEDERASSRGSDDVGDGLLERRVVRGHPGLREVFGEQRDHGAPVVVRRLHQQRFRLIEPEPADGEVERPARGQRRARGQDGRAVTVEVIHEARGHFERRTSEADVPLGAAHPGHLVTRRTEHGTQERVPRGAERLGVSRDLGAERIRLEGALGFERLRRLTDLPESVADDLQTQIDVDGDCLDFLPRGLASARGSEGDIGARCALLGQLVHERAQRLRQRTDVVARPADGDLDLLRERCEAGDRREREHFTTAREPLQPSRKARLAVAISHAEHVDDVAELLHAERGAEVLRGDILEAVGLVDHKMVEGR